MAQATEKPKQKPAGKIAIVQIRGNINLRQEVNDTLHMLGLQNQHNCVIRDATPSIMGMVKKVQHVITWGEVDAETEQALRKKVKEGAIPLHPPRGGFERKGIKMPFAKGGALGYRGKEINALLKRMI